MKFFREIDPLPLGSIFPSKECALSAEASISFPTSRMPMPASSWRKAAFHVDDPAETVRIIAVFFGGKDH